MLWPEAVAALRREAGYRRTRLGRMEYLAQAGRVKFDKFDAARAHAEGYAVGLEEALQIVARVGAEPEPALPLDMAVILLAKQGLDIEVIANRCGSSVHEVGASLVRYVQAAAAENEGGDGG